MPATLYPQVITRPEDPEIRHYLGVAHVLPLFGLFHPVLPYRHNDKLVMPLCRTCVKEQISQSLHDKSHRCSHSDDKRMLRGT